MDALRALHSALPPGRFWHPDTLQVVGEEAMHRFADTVIRSVAPSNASRIMALVDELKALPIMERLHGLATSRLLQGEFMAGFAASFDLGIPFTLVYGYRERQNGPAIEISNARLLQEVTWLPEDLSLPEGLKFWGDTSNLESFPSRIEVGNLDLAFCTNLLNLPAHLHVKGSLDVPPHLEALPEGLVVDGNLSLSHWQEAKSIEDLPQDLIVGYDLILPRVLARYSDDEIYARIESAGDIIR